MIAWCRHRSEELRVGMMFLTRLPMGRVARPVPMAATVWTWPLAGLAVGAVFALVHAGAGALGLAPAIAVVLALVAALLASGGLHEDGLADLADGAGGGGDAARRLSIMKDSRLGSYGAMALIFVITLNILGWLEIESPAFLAMALGALSRMGMPLCALAFAPAQPSGLAHHLRQGLQSGAVAVALALGIALGLALLGTEALVLGGTCLVVQLGLCLYAQRVLGGITGDVLGAGQVLGALASLLLAGRL